MEKEIENNDAYDHAHDYSSKISTVTGEMYRSIIPLEHRKLEPASDKVENPISDIYDYYNNVPIQEPGILNQIASPKYIAKEHRSRRNTTLDRIPGDISLKEITNLAKDFFDTATFKLPDPMSNFLDPPKKPQKAANCIITNQKETVLTLRSKTGVEILRFENEGDIYLKNEFVTNDFQIIEGFREYLRQYKLHP